MMVKPLSFKGEKKPKKRKRTADNDDVGPSGKFNPEHSLEPTTPHDRDEGETADDTWVSAEALPDVVGPVMIVLPSDSPTAISCDANGKVFALNIENIMDANPLTAEPHDVRQVWVANRIVGTENFRFKGHHGRFLACDKYGLLSATSEAVSPLESFTLIPTAETPGTFQLQTSHNTFLSVREPTSATKPPEIRGDAEEVNFSTTLRIRMQARFKPRIKASKEEKAREKISRKELETAVGRRLEEEEVRVLKRARREGDYHERLLDLKVKGKHDKYG